MPSYTRLRARLTREGWYYLFVLTFIVVGAALCHVNLLVVLGGMMLAPLLINWRLSLASLRGVTARPLPLGNVHSGQALVAEFEITNHRRWFAAWMMAVEDRWVYVGNQAAPRGERWWVDWIPDVLEMWSLLGLTRAIAFTPCIPPGETRRLRYNLAVAQRGLYRSRQLVLRSCYPLGLVEAVLTIGQPREMLVMPRLGHLSGEWTHLVTSTLVGEGEQRVRQRASEGDFFAVRPWQSGDSTRWIHWRTTARAARPMVRQFEREPSPTVALVLDPFLPAQPTAGERARLEAAISFLATALADLSQRDMAQVAVLVAGPDKPCWIGAPSPIFLDEVYQRLARLPAVSGDHRPGIAETLQAEVPPSACVLMISSRPGADQELQPEVPSQEAADRSSTVQHTICVASSAFSSLYALDA